MSCAIRPVARDDIIRQFRYYLSEHALDAATRFLAAIDESIERILGMPQIGSLKQLKNPALAGLRSWPVQGFEDIRIYYLVNSDAILIVRILRGARDVSKILERESGLELGSGHT